MRALLIPPLTGILIASLLGACSGSPTRSDVRDYLEESTGTSITYVTTPAAFVSEQPGLASSGRDYVYVAPLLVSSGGERTTWLWLGIWSTVDRQARDDGASPLRLGRAQIAADDEPMDLDLQSIDSRPAGVRRLPYETPVPPTQEFLVPVTRSQIQRLGNARILTLTDRPDAGGIRQWAGEERTAAMLGEFAEAIGAPMLNAASKAVR